MPKSKPQASSKSKKTDGAESSPLNLKERLAEKRKAALAVKELTQVVVSAVFASLFFGLIGYLIGGPKMGGGAFLGILSFILSFKYPREGIIFFLIYLPFGGTVTYALAGGNAIFQLAKDIFYFPALITIFQKMKRAKTPFFPKNLVPWLLLLIVSASLTLFFVNGMQQLSPKGGDKPFLLGILGLKVLIGYVPLIACAYYLIRQKKDLLLISRLHVVLALICCGLAFVQYWMLTSGRCVGTRNAVGSDLFKASLEARCFVGGSLLYSPDQGMIRLPGTFVAPWQWGWFLISNAFFTFASAFCDPVFLWRIAGLASMGAVTMMAVVSGQRIALVLVPVVFVILLVLTGQVANLKRFIPVLIGLAVLAGIAMVAYPEVVQERWTSFVQRWTASSPDDFIEQQMRWALGRAGILGNGVGRATNSARIFGETQLVETFYPKLAFEIGFLGAAAFVAFVTSITVLTFKAYRSVKDPTIRSFGACFWVFVLCISYNTYYYPLDVDPVAVYYWFFAGVILKLPELDKQEQLLLKAAEEDLPASKKKQKKQRLKQRASPS